MSQTISHNPISRDARAGATVLGAGTVGTVTVTWAIACGNVTTADGHRLTTASWTIEGETATATGRDADGRTHTLAGPIAVHIASTGGLIHVDSDDATLHMTLRPTATGGLSLMFVSTTLLTAIALPGGRAEWPELG
jgi:hypothetical protein